MLKETPHNQDRGFCLEAFSNGEHLPIFFTTIWNLCQAEARRVRVVQ